MSDFINKAIAANFFKDRENSLQLETYKDAPTFNRGHLDECRTYVQGEGNGITHEVIILFESEVFDRRISHEDDYDHHRPPEAIIDLSRLKDEALELQKQITINIEISAQKRKRFLELTL